MISHHKLPVDAAEHRRNVDLLAEKIATADAILVGAAFGMSTACDFRFFYEKDALFERYLGEFGRRYGYTGAFNGFYYRYPSLQARWAFLARLGVLLYECPIGDAYHDLMTLLQGKDYHILTTNQDFQFTRVVPKEKLSAIQGDFRYYQCSNRCHDGLYLNRERGYEMNAAIDGDLCIPEVLIPRCPHCGAELEPWVRGYTFLEGQKYRQEYEKVNTFLAVHKDHKLLFLELGVGRMTPMFIQEPFWNLTAALPQAYYITINSRDTLLPEELVEKGWTIREDIVPVLRDAVALAARKEG